MGGNAEPSSVSGNAELGRGNDLEFDSRSQAPAHSASAYSTLTRRAYRTEQELLNPKGVSKGLWAGRDSPASALYKPRLLEGTGVCGL